MNVSALSIVQNQFQSLPKSISDAKRNARPSAIELWVFP
jgi:hypothetical protein